MCTERPIAAHPPNGKKKKNPNQNHFAREVFRQFRCLNPQPDYFRCRGSSVCITLKNAQLLKSLHFCFWRDRSISTIAEITFVSYKPQSPKGVTEAIADKRSHAVRRLLGDKEKPVAAATVSRRGLGKGFALTSSFRPRLGCRNTPPLTLVCKVCVPIPFPFQRLLKAATGKPCTSRATEPRDAGQRDSTGKVRSLRHSQAAFGGAVPKKQPAAPGRCVLNRCLL